MLNYHKRLFYIFWTLIVFLGVVFLTMKDLHYDLTSILVASNKSNLSNKHSTWSLPIQSSTQVTRKYYTAKLATKNQTVQTTNKFTKVTKYSTIKQTSINATVTTESAFVQNKKYFTWSMSVRQMSMMLSLLKVFVTQIEKHNITYIPCGGTLVGINRHHGMIPWDDDIDILVATDQKQHLINALSELRPTYYLEERSGNITGKWKFYKEDGDKIRNLNFRYPYIDIFFMHDLSKEELYIELYFQTRILKRDIYPMVRRPYNGVLLNTPCNMEAVLKLSVSTDHFTNCLSSSYNHSREYLIVDQIGIDCKLLKNDFPFVRRQVTNSSGKLQYKEVLMKGNKLLQVVRYSAPNVCSDVPSYYPSDIEFITLYN